MGKDQNERSCCCGEVRERCWLKEGKGKTNENGRKDKRKKETVSLPVVEMTRKKKVPH